MKEEGHQRNSQKMAVRQPVMVKNTVLLLIVKFLIWLPSQQGAFTVYFLVRNTASL